jgi:hypothetical protein
MGIRGIVHGELSTIEIVCWLICLPVMVVLLVNNWRNKVLDSSMTSLIWAIIAVADWAHYHNVWFAAGWAFLAVLYALGACREYKKSQCKTVDFSVQPVDLGGKTDG